MSRIRTAPDTEAGVTAGEVRAMLAALSSPATNRLPAAPVCPNLPPNREPRGTATEHATIP